MTGPPALVQRAAANFKVQFEKIQEPGAGPDVYTCLLYTSDAADERSSVDLGGRRIIKKKKTTSSARATNVCYRNDGERTDKRNH